MRKHIGMTISMLFVLTLCGCAQNTVPDTTSAQVNTVSDTPSAQVSTVETASATPTTALNKITCVSLTRREELLASALMGDTFVFDYTVDETYDYVRLWVKAYASGEEIEGQYDDKLFETDPNGTLIFSIGETCDEAGEADTMKITLCAGSFSLNSGSSNVVTSHLPYIRNDGEGGEAYGVPSITLPSSGETALAYVRYYSGDFVDAINSAFFIDYKNKLNLIANDDLVYVFGCTFFAAKPMA